MLFKLVFYVSNFFGPEWISLLVILHKTYTRSSKKVNSLMKIRFFAGAVMRNVSVLPSTSF